MACRIYCETLTEISVYQVKYKNITVPPPPQLKILYKTLSTHFVN